MKLPPVSVAPVFNSVLSDIFATSKLRKGVHIFPSTIEIIDELVCGTSVNITNQPLLLSPDDHFEDAVILTAYRQTAAIENCRKLALLMSGQEVASLYSSGGLRWRSESVMARWT